MAESDLLRDFRADSFAFGSINDESEGWELPSYTFDPFLGFDFDPFALMSGGSNSLVDVGTTVDYLCTGTPNNEGDQLDSALWELSSGNFVAPKNQTPDKPLATLTDIPKVEVYPVASTSGPSENTTRPSGKRTKRPASKKTRLTSGQMARKRSTPEEYITTQTVTATELLDRELPTPPYQFTDEDKARFLEHVRRKEDRDAFCMLPDSQKAAVLDTPQDIAAYRAVHSSSHSLKNPEERLWVCRASVKVVRTNGGEDIGQVEHVCGAVGSWDSLRRHWRRSHLA